MTINVTPRRADYSGDGTTTEFAVPFQFFEIEVYVDGVLQAAGSDYSVSQEDPGLAGAVLFIAENGATPANGTDVVIVGVTRRVQETDYVDNDDFPAEVHEAALDRLTMIAQEQDDAFLLTVRAVAPHPEIAPLDFVNNPNTIVFVGADGNVTLQSAEEILGGIDIQDAIDAAIAADASADAASGSASAAAASAVAAAASAVTAADATAVLSADAHFTGLPEFEIGLRIGKNGGGNSVAEFYDDTNDAWRAFRWDDTLHDFVFEDTGGDRKAWHSGNFTSQAEAEAGTENTKGMTALRVAQAISALAGDGAFPSGTIGVFGNSSAPPNWTKKTDLTDYAMRITSGPVGLSGSVGYATVFSSRTPTGTVSGMTLDTTRIPSHTHPDYYETAVSSLGRTGGGGYGVHATAGAWTTGGAAGGGGSHDHGFVGTPMSFSTLTRDVILAEKD